LQTARALGHNPLSGLSIRIPTTLPRVPTDEELRAVPETSQPTFEGVRNLALLLVMADAGLRAGEIVRLLVEDWNPQERSLSIQAGKGQKDRVTFVSATTVRAIRDCHRLGPRLTVMLGG
jgi:integrase